MLDDRIPRELFHGRWPDAAAFDCDNDLHLDELASRLLERFRRNRDVEAFALLMRLSRCRLLAIARSVVRRLAWDVSPQELVEGALGRLFSEPDCAGAPSGSFLVVARGLLEQQARHRATRRAQWEEHPCPVGAVSCAYGHERRLAARSWPM